MPSRTPSRRASGENCVTRATRFVFGPGRKALLRLTRFAAPRRRDAFASSTATGPPRASGVRRSTACSASCGTKTQAMRIAPPRTPAAPARAPPGRAPRALASPRTAARRPPRTAASRAQLDDGRRARAGRARRRGHQHRRPLLLGPVLEADPARRRQARPRIAEIERDQIEPAGAQHQIGGLRRHIGRAADPQQAPQRDPGCERAPRIQPAADVDQRRRLARRDRARQRRVQDRRPPRRPPPDQLAQRRPRPAAPEQPVERRDPAAAPPAPILETLRRDQVREQSRIERRPRRHPNKGGTEHMSRST